jgi:hypothetical protein
MKTKLTAVKNFVIDNKVAIIATTAAIAATALVIRNQNQINEFLEEKGLTDEFYNQD